MALGIDIARLSITRYPDPILRQVCRPVETFDDELRQLAARMLELMRAEKGVGLAAPQVRVPIRLFVCNPTGQPDNDFVVVNPVLSNQFGAEEHDEGCLCLPEVSVPIRRAQSIKLRGCDLSGQPLERDGQELEGRIWQHETDHLNGRLIVDYMSEASAIANRRALKQLRDAYKNKKSA